MSSTYASSLRDNSFKYLFILEINLSISNANSSICVEVPYHQKGSSILRWYFHLQRVCLPLVVKYLKHMLSFFISIHVVDNLWESSCIFDLVVFEESQILRSNDYFLAFRIKYLNFRQSYESSGPPIVNQVHHYLIHILLLSVIIGIERIVEFFHCFVVIFGIGGVCFTVDLGLIESQKRRSFWKYTLLEGVSL